MSLDSGVLDVTFYDVEVRYWLGAAATALLALVALRLAQAYVVRRFARDTAGERASLFGFAADLASRTSLLVLVAVALYVGALVAELPAHLERLLHTLTVFAVLFQAAVWMHRTVSYVLTRYVDRTLEHDAGRTTTLAFLGFLVRLALWVIILLVALDNLGVNITALVTGLGIGGIAMALATQSILGDIFASLAIVLDKPFVVGDYIVVDALMGHVEHIGLKTTRLRSLSGEEIVFANSELLKSRIRNFRGNYERRVLFTVGVTHQTAHPTLARIPSIIREVVQAQPNTRFARAHFAKLAESALIFEVVYYVLSGDEMTFMDVQGAINLALYARFQREGIEFAAPAHALEVRETAAASRN